MNQLKIILHIYKTFFLVAICLPFIVLRKYDIVFRILQKLGPVFIKFFQWISNRKDLLPTKITKCLSRFQDENEEHEFHHTLDIIESNKIDLILFDDKPLASGSVAQVYTGLFKGRQVAIKVIHPNYEENVDIGINVLNSLITHLPVIKKIKKCLDINDFFDMIRKQRDLEYEVENIRTFRRNFFELTYKNMEKIVWKKLIEIPKVYYSTKDIIIESYCDGENIYDYCKENPTETMNALSLLWYVYYEMILEHNFVHGDIHPGNLLFKLENNKTKLIVLDFGIINVMEQELHEKFKCIFKKSIFEPDIVAAIQFGLACNVNKDFEEEKLQENLTKYMEHRKENSDTGMFGTLIKIMNESNLLIKSGYMNIILGLILLENYVADLVGDQIKFRKHMIRYGIEQNLLSNCRMSEAYKV